MRNHSTDRFPFLAAALLAGLLTAGCGGDEPAPKQPDATAEQAPAKGTQGGESPSSPQRPASHQPKVGPLLPRPEMTVTENSTADGTAVIKGRVLVRGVVARRKPIAIDHIPGCKGHEPPLPEDVIAADDGGLQNVVCYVARGMDSSHFQPLPEEPAILDQVGCTYVPHVMLMRTGQQLVIRNTDDIRHNVNASPWRRKNEQFNQLVTKGEPDLEVSFGEQEVGIRFGCDIHPWMHAYVTVLDHDFADITGADGTYEIKGLPPGPLVFEVWHEEFGTQTIELDLQAGQTVELDWTYLSERHKGGRTLPVPK